MWGSRQECVHYAPSEDTASRKSRQLGENGDTDPLQVAMPQWSLHLKPVKRTERLGTVSDLGRTERSQAKERTKCSLCTERTTKERPWSSAPWLPPADPGHHLIILVRSFLLLVFLSQHYIPIPQISIESQILAFRSNILGPPLSHPSGKFHYGTKLPRMLTNPTHPVTSKDLQHHPITCYLRVKLLTRAILWFGCEMSPTGPSV